MYHFFKFRLIMSKLLPNYKFLVKDRKTCDNVIIDVGLI